MELNTILTYLGQRKLAQGIWARKPIEVTVILGSGRYWPDIYATTLKEPLPLSQQCSVIDDITYEEDGNTISLHIVIEDYSNSSYSVGEVGLISEDTLITLTSQPTEKDWIFVKSSSAYLVGTMTLTLSLKHLPYHFEEVNHDDS